MRDSERKTLAFIQKFVDIHGYSPKLHEICEGIGIHSKGTVSRYIQGLIDAGYLDKQQGKSRGLSILKLPEGGRGVYSSIPLVGAIAAGKPIEAVSQPEPFELSGLLKEGNFVLKVRGDSMKDEGILDGDYVICHAQNTANDGEIVVALIQGEEATLKRLYWQDTNTIKLVPANATLSPMVYPASHVQIQGVFKGLIRMPHIT